MKRSILIFVALGFMLFSFQAIQERLYKADNTNSVIHWKGFKPTGSHFGTIKILEGHFNINENKITGGNFIIDMNSIVDLDMEQDNKYNTKLVNHLKSADFFDVVKYPEASFKITSTENIEDKVLVKGDLKIKNKINPIVFLTNVQIDKNQVRLKSESFKINRSKWDVRYKSKSFFDDLADKFIYDEMEIKLEIEANK